MSSEKKRTLLVVDDEKELREGIAFLCEDLTPSVITAANGKEALQIVREGGIDAVLTDINMPAMTGLQLLAEIRYIGLDTPVVILTGYGDKANTSEALRLGATDFLDKPVEETALLTVMERALELGVALREVQEEVDKLYAQSDLPADRLVELKRAKKAIWMMRENMAIYSTKRKSS